MPHHQEERKAGIRSECVCCLICWTLLLHHKCTKLSEISLGKTLSKFKTELLISGSNMLTSQSLCFEANLF